MNLFFAALGIFLTLLIAVIVLYLLTARRYQSADSVAHSVDVSFIHSLRAISGTQVRTAALV